VKSYTSRIAVTFSQLRSFLAVVNGGSVRAAAGDLVVSQPAISAAVATLSRELDVELLERAGRGVRPTPAGREFAAYAADVLGLLEQGRRAAHDIQAGGGPALTIAAVTTAAESFVPPLMRAFAEAHPEVSLTLEVGNRDHVLAMVSNHQADLAIGGRPPGNERIAARPILANELLLISAPDDPLARRATVAPAELSGRRWLLREPGSGTRAVNEEYLAVTGIEVRRMTLGSNGAIKQAVRAGLGLSFISRAAIGTELDAGLLGVIAVSPGPQARDWYALRSAVGPQRPVTTDFISFVCSPAAARILAGGAPGGQSGPDAYSNVAS
jgi:LysR family transcriptional regulator, low CO2-responsive transcriptional regulator